MKSTPEIHAAWKGRRAVEENGRPAALDDDGVTLTHVERHHAGRGRDDRRRRAGAGDPLGLLDLPHLGGQVPGVAVAQLFDRVDAGGLQELTVLRADAGDPHQVLFDPLGDGDDFVRLSIEQPDGQVPQDFFDSSLTRDGC